jgi:CheY-like chemotaxis protein
MIATVCADRSAGLALRISDYLVKPIDPHRLMASLAAIGAPPQSGRNILIVDDDRHAPELLGPVLREWGYDPRFAASGAAALDQIAQRKPFMMVVDLMMPEMSGLEFLHRVRANADTRDIPAIVMSAKEIGSDELSELKSLAQIIVRKGSGGNLDLLEALRECITPYQ